jgi:hypothetical protein
MGAAGPEQHGGEYSVYSADPGGVLRRLVCRPPNKRFPTLMWQSVICCLLAG